MIITRSSGVNRCQVCDKMTEEGVLVGLKRDSGPTPVLVELRCRPCHQIITEAWVELALEDVEVGYGEGGGPTEPGEGGESKGGHKRNEDEAVR